ncbi:DUF2076 family protein [Massilia sp. G4R7]|uniref:DUF2076 family protein n=1 Tax=Massilia phyllostachyos TaxID=2898585 RepID=A0ABS8Q8T4_9BURK|nr:DUF2076 family protein [Massilia phyllostachyos]MCD2517351.1 DUF2076 family protein [Massilia phyllostachyos]
MSPSDTQKLHDFLGQLVQARGIQKDPEADALIQRAVTQQPDAAYLLVQRAFLMEQALDAAKSRIAMLEGQLDNQQGNSSGGFLDPNKWGNRHRAQSQPQPHQSQHMSWQHATPASMSRSGGSGMLGSIAATAAGVAAGSFLFHGLDKLFHDHDAGNASHLLSDNDQSASSLADQAGINDIGQSDKLLGEGDSGGIDGPGGFFDGDGSDEGLFS